MPKGSPKLTAARREEIINACERLYETMSFKDITLKEIGSETSFTRTSLYNYFRTKEEIFLALFKREYDRWNGTLEAVINENDALTAEELSDLIAGSVADRPRLLKLLSMNIYDMEENSRREELVSFKRSYGKSIDNVRRIIEKFCPGIDGGDFAYMFFPFMFGIYPYTTLTEKQISAMKEAGAYYEHKTIYELTKDFVLTMLSRERNE